MNATINIICYMQKILADEELNIIKNKSHFPQKQKVALSHGQPFCLVSVSILIQRYTMLF